MSKTIALTNAAHAVCGDRIICCGDYAVITRVELYSPVRTALPLGWEPLCPIRRDWYALRLVTPRGSRWFGFPEPPFLDL